MSEASYFKLSNFTVGYEGKAVVADVDFDIKKGQIVSLVGPNGAGKTTIIRSIMNQLKPVAGAVYIDGKEAASMDENSLAKLMSVVLTTRMRTELMTVRDIVETGRYPYTGHLGILSSLDKEIVEKAIRLINIEDLADKDFMKISDGQKQRVMLARAIAQEPEIIILDEPTSFLDIKYKLEFLSTIYRLSREHGLTVVMSLHEVDLARKISDRVACFKAGALDKYGKPDEVMTDEYINYLFDIDTADVVSKLL